MYYFQILVGLTIFICTTLQVNPQKQEASSAEAEERLSKHSETNKSVLKHPILIAQLPKFSNGTLTKVKNKTLAIKDTNSKQTANVHHTDFPKINQTFEQKSDEVTSGAITRGILVFVATSCLFILYVGIKTYRRKAQDKRRTIVRKYGVRARRSDVEMEPLPLSDDDEDETLFDLSVSRQTSN